MPPLEIVRRQDTLYSDGQWYGPLGVPLGVADTDTHREFFVALTADGTTVGEKHQTREHAEQTQQTLSDNRVDEFYDTLCAMTDEQVAAQSKYWLGE